MKKLVVALCALALVSVSCITRGKNFDFADARQVEMGMTEEDVLTIMGEPSNTSIDLTGELWMWIYVDAAMNSKSFAVKVKDGKVIYIQR